MVALALVQGDLEVLHLHLSNVRRSVVTLIVS